MLYGNQIDYKGVPATVIVSGKSTALMTEEIASIVEAKHYFESVTQPSAMDRIKMKMFHGVKLPITIFIHSDPSDRDLFKTCYGIELIHESEWEYYQEKMYHEDEISSLVDEKEMGDLTALTGVADHNSIAKELGIDKFDPWDTRTAKQKAEDLLNNSHKVRELVEQGLLTDEAVAGADEQSGSMESAVLALVDHIKSGGQMIDPNNIPPQFQDQIDEMIKEGDIRKEDIPRFIDDLNKKVKEYCENDQLDEIMRIFGGVNMDATGTDGRIFINTKKADKKQIAAPETETDDIEKKLFETKSGDELHSILKSEHIDGSLKTDAEQYVFDNTSLDKYDLSEFISEIGSEGTEDTFEIPENVSDICDSETKEYAFRAHKLDEDANVYAFYPKNVKIASDNIIGTTHVGNYMVTDSGCVIFTPKNNTDQSVYFVTDTGYKTIFNITF